MLAWLLCCNMTASGPWLIPAKIQSTVHGMVLVEPCSCRHGDKGAALHRWQALSEQEWRHRGSRACCMQPPEAGRDAAAALTHHAGPHRPASWPWMLLQKRSDRLPCFPSYQGCGEGALMAGISVWMASSRLNLAHQHFHSESRAETIHRWAHEHRRLTTYVRGRCRDGRVFVGYCGDLQAARDFGRTTASSWLTPSTQMFRHGRSIEARSNDLTQSLLRHDGRHTWGPVHVAGRQPVLHPTSIICTGVMPAGLVNGHHPLAGTLLTSAPVQA